jgi:hypothetical protein
MQRDHRWFPWLWLSVGSIVFLVVVTGLFGESKDLENYNTIFESLRVFGREGEDEGRIEIGFKWLSTALIGLLLPNIGVYGVIATFSILVKSIAINAFCSTRSAFFWAVLFMLVCFTPLHELTQLRAAIAIAFLFAAYASLLFDRSWLSILFAAMAVAFHVSAALLFPLFAFVFAVERGFLSLTRIRVLFFGAGIFAACVFLIALLVNSFDDVLLVIEAYQEVGFGDEALNPLSASVVLNVAMLATGLMLWKGLTANMRYVLLFQSVGAAIFYSTMDFQVVAQRVFELLQVFWVFYIADGEQSASPLVRVSTRAFILISVAAYSYIYFFSGRFFL